VDVHCSGTDIRHDVPKSQSECSCPGWSRVTTTKPHSTRTPTNVHETDSTAQAAMYTNVILSQLYRLLCLRHNVVFPCLSSTCLYVLWLSGMSYQNLPEEANMVTLLLPCGTNSTPYNSPFPPNGFSDFTPYTCYAYC